MATNQPVTKGFFTKRLADLCLKSGLQDLPKDMTDRHILLKSALLTIGQPGKNFSEKEINEKLELWSLIVGPVKFLDPVTMRRNLIDYGYLTRSNDGSAYQVAEPGPHMVLFDEAVEGLDISQVLTDAREDIARRKKEYLEKSRGK